MTFDELNLSEPILKALQEKNYSTPTPIQEKAIPEILDRKDVLGCAQTGTGKTGAFALPIVEIINDISNGQKRPLIQSLIVTPTRELAIQIGENIRDYSKHTKIRHAVIFGGVKQGPQVSQLRGGVHILVATPGRLLDLYDQGYISLKAVELFVLDEADRMLDMGFIHDIKKLLKVLPKERQSLFFSATMPNNIKELSSTILNNPVRVEVAPVSSTAETIQQRLYYTNRDTKNDLLKHLLEDPEIDQALVFTGTKHGADKVVKYLAKNRIEAAAIHGNKSQNQRQKALKDFKNKNIRVLIATDIAARGIDIDKLKYVINHDIPNVSETYVHRIGRSGRAGEEGVAISICEPEENAFVRDIEKLTKQTIPVIEDNPFPQTDKPMTAREKKEFEKEKNKRKMERINAARKKKQEQGGGQNKFNSGKPRRR